jgi:hypothetical protein
VLAAVAADPQGFVTEQAIPPRRAALHG